MRTNVSHRDENSRVGEKYVSTQIRKRQRVCKYQLVNLFIIKQ